MSGGVGVEPQTNVWAIPGCSASRDFNSNCATGEVPRLFLIVQFHAIIEMVIINIW